MPQMTPESNQSDVRPANPKKRVLFIITQSEIGGAQQFLAQLLNHLDKTRFEFSVVAGSDGTNELKALLPAGTEYRVARRLRRNPSLTDDVMAIPEMKSIIAQFRPDVLFLNSSKAGFIGAFAARGLRSKLPNMAVVYRIGGWTFNDPWPIWKKISYRMLEKLSAGWKDYIIVNNGHDLEQAREYRIRPRQKVLLIHNGIDPYMEFMEKEEARVKLLDIISRKYLKEQDGGPVPLFKAGHLVGTIANFYPAKGLSQLIRAAALTDESTAFVIIGDGALRPEIESEIRESGLTRRVFLAGKVADARKYIPAFDVFVLPSLKEGFPWTVLEAMAAKVPVIATAVGAVPEVIENNKSGIIVQPGQPDQLAQAIQTLLRDEGLRRELAIQAHQTLIKNFSLHKMVEHYQQLFTEK